MFTWINYYRNEFIKIFFFIKTRPKFFNFIKHTMDSVEHIIVRVKYENQLRFISVPINDLNPSTFAFRGECEYVHIECKLVFSIIK